MSCGAGFSSRPGRSAMRRGIPASFALLLSTLLGLGCQGGGAIVLDDDDRSDDELTNIFRSHCPSQVPPFFEIVPLPNEITSWLTFKLITSFNSVAFRTISASCSPARSRSKSSTSQSCLATSTTFRKTTNPPMILSLLSALSRNKSS